jgi:hypothetical protein
MRKSREPHLSDVLTGLAEKAGNGMTLGEILTAFGERSFGPPILLLAALSFIPLSSAVFGLPLMFITAQLMVGQTTVWLPAKFKGYRISSDMLKSIVDKVQPRLVKAERLLRPRGFILVSTIGERLAGAACFVLAVILFLPIPFVNIPPAFAICCFAVGLTEQDSNAMALGWLATIGTGFLLSLIGGAMLAGVWAFFSALLGF